MAKSSFTDIDKGWKKIVQAMVGEPGRVAHVGIQGDEAAIARETEDGGTISNVQLAVTHEFGAPEVGVPERSFIRSAFDDNVKKYNGMLTRGAKKISKGEIDQSTVVGLIGEQVVADIRRGIQRGIEPENTQATKDKKGSDKPLIDTGVLVGSLTFKVTDENEAKDDDGS